MIIIKVEVWPKGNLNEAHEIARGEIENRGEIDGIADYHVSWIADNKIITGTVTNHIKGSILELIKKSIP